MCLYRNRCANYRFMLRGSNSASGVFVAVHSVPLQPGDGMGGFRRHMLGIADPDRADEWRGRRSPRSTGPPTRTPRWRVSLHNNAGWARFDAGDYPGAIAEFELAKNAATRWGTPQQVAWADEALAEAREAGR